MRQLMVSRGGCLTPASWNEIAEKLTEIRIHLPQQDFGETARGELFLKAYQRALSDVPFDIIETTLDRMLLDPKQKFFPRIAEIMAIVGPKVAERRNEMKVLEELLELHD